MITARAGPTIVLLAALVLGFSSPDSGSPADTTAADPATADATGPAYPAWSYEGETGPGQWADLSVDYAACAGDQQSPIDLTGASSPTSPPCSEIVRWVVLDTPIEASAAQLETLRAQHDGNARPVQPLGDRALLRVSP
jgi:carbonic anhydrase